MSQKISWDFLRLGMIVGMVIALSMMIASHSVDDVDTYLLRLSRTGAPEYQPLGTAKQQSMIRDITSLGSGIVLTILTICVALYHILRKERRTGLFIALTILLGWFTMAGLKLVYQRERPTFVPHLMHENSLSLPSGHSMMSMVVYMTLAGVYAQRTTRRSMKVYYFTLASLLALCIGATRVYLGVHHPSDVLAGWLLGLAWVQGAFLIKKTWFALE